MSTIRPMAMHWVLVKMLWEYADSVMAVPTTPIKKPLRFLRSIINCCRSSDLSVLLLLLILLLLLGIGPKAYLRSIDPKSTTSTLP